VLAGDDPARRLRCGGVTLLDGLGVWLAGALHRGVDVEAAVASLIARSSTEELIVVAEEAGQGLLPLDPVARAWLDALGSATQVLSAAAGRVDLIVAGRAIRLGGRATPPPPEMRRHGDSAVAPGEADHAVNVIEPGPPAWLREALARALDRDGRRYPDETAAVVALAGLHGRAPGEVVPTNGAAEALWLLGPALRPRLAACVHPAFTEAEAGLRAHGVSVVRVLRDPAAGFRLDPAAVPDDADLVVVGHPASPSGTLDPASALLALRRPGRTVVVDEAFMSLVPGEPGSLAGDPLPDVVIVRSLTKLLSVAGLRVGYALAAPPLAGALRAVRPPWSANALALAGICAAAARPGDLAALAQRAASERDDLARRLAAIPGLRTWPAAANFCLIEVPDGPATVAALRARGIAVRPAGTFPGLHEGHLRLTARTPERNARLAAALAEAVT
jgi:histidinol-phosphate/aromatic aminotransferase/cobyric acid decarboxylase-like protein